MKVIFNITENKNKATFQQEVVKINTSFNQTQNIVKPKFQIGYYPLPVGLENYYSKNETDLLLENYYLKSETYSQNEVDDFLDLKADLSSLGNYYTKLETYSQTEIDNSLALKLDKGTYTGTASDLFTNDQNLLQSLQNEQSARYYADQSLENSKQNKLETVSGNTGVGKTDASATEKLDIAGRAKSDGQVFNETTSAILPREIKFKDGKFKAALSDGVEKAVLLEGDISIGDSLLGEFIYNGNQEIYFSSFNYSNSIGVTTVPHGLNVGTTYQGGIVANAFKNIDTYSDLKTFNANSITIPWEFSSNFIVLFKVISANEIQILEWNGGGNPTAINTTSTNNLNNLNTIDWHLEKPPTNTFFDIITNLPKGIKNLKIEIFGCYWKNFSPFTGHRIFPSYYDSSGSSYTSGEFDTIDLNWGTNKTNLIGYSIIEIRASRLIGLISGFYWSQYRASGNNTFTGVTGSGAKAFVKNNSHNGFSSLKIIGNYFFNGTKFKIYKA